MAPLTFLLVAIGLTVEFIAWTIGIGRGDHHGPRPLVHGAAADHARRRPQPDTSLSLPSRELAETRPADWVLPEAGADLHLRVGRCAMILVPFFRRRTILNPPGFL